MPPPLEETPIAPPLATPLTEIDVQTEEAIESFIPLGGGFLVPRCSSPCPCCFYTLSGCSHQGVYSMGWRKFGGTWSWWHGHGPHAFVDCRNPSLGVLGPGVPACDCCYYRIRDEGTLGPGWYRNDSDYWRWSQYQAPHAHDHWHLQGDDALYMIGRPSVGCAGPVEAMRALDREEEEWLAAATPADASSAPLQAPPELELEGPVELEFVRFLPFA